MRLNQGTSDVQVYVLLETAAWRRITGDAPREGRPALGWDFGQSEAMSACAAYWPSSGRLEALASFPREPGLGERGTADGVGDLYRRMFQRGELVVTGGEAVDLREFVELARERFGVPSAMAEARTVSDPAGNSKLAKSTQGGRRRRAKDDAAAAILAVAIGSRRAKRPKRPGWRYAVAG